MGFNRYGTPLLSTMSNERETNLLTLSPLPKGDILNSSKTMRFLSSTVTMCLYHPSTPLVLRSHPPGPGAIILTHRPTDCFAIVYPVRTFNLLTHPPQAQSFSPTDPPIASQSFTRYAPLTFSPTHPRRAETRLVPFIEPYFGILHLAQQTETVQGFPQHRASFLDVRLITLRLLAQLTKPVDERHELTVQNALEIFFHESGQRRRHATRADRHARMPGFDHRRHVHRGGLGKIDGPQQELALPRLGKQRPREISVSTDHVEDKDRALQIGFTEVPSAMDDFGGRSQLLQSLMQGGRDHNDFRAGIEKSLSFFCGLFVAPQHEHHITFDVECDRKSRVRCHDSPPFRKGGPSYNRAFSRVNHAFPF